MFKISQIISKDIISIYECEKIGTIKNIILNKDFKKVKQFIYFNDNTDAEMCVDIQNIHSLSEDCLMIKNITKTSFEILEENNPMNKQVFSLSDSSEKGRICDIIINDKGDILNFLTTKGLSLSSDEIMNISDSLCILKGERAVKIANFKPRTKPDFDTEILDNIKVKIVRMESREKPTPSLPAKITTNVTNLLGKKAIKTIMGLNNEIIIKENNVINKNTLDKAKLHNKTNELLFNSI